MILYYFKLLNTKKAFRGYEEGFDRVAQALTLACNGNARACFRLNQCGFSGR